jgi:hypothetical protein
MNDRGFKQFFFKDRQKLLTLMRYSPSTFDIWWFLYMRTGKDDTCIVAQDIIEAETGYSHNTVDDAKKLLKEHKWLVGIGLVPIADGKWVAKYRAQIGLSLPQKLGCGQTPKKPPKHTPRIGVTTDPKNWGTIVDTHLVPAGEGVQGGESILGVEGGEAPPSPKAKTDKRSASADDKENSANVDAMAAAQPKAAALVYGSSASDDANPNPKTYVNTAGGCAPRTPARGGTRGLMDSKTQKAKKKLVAPEPQNDAEHLAVLLWHYIQGRLSLGHKIDVPFKWLSLWSGDFKSLLDEGRDRHDIELAIWVSQFPAKQKYFIRSLSICDNIDQLSEYGLRKEKSFRLVQCKHPDCICWFTNGRDYGDHLALCHAQAAPPPDEMDVAEEEWLYIEEELNEQGHIIFADEFDPFYNRRTQILSDDDGHDVYEEVAPGEWQPVLIEEDWGQHDLDYELPEPFKEPAKGDIRPDDETELPEFVKRSDLMAEEFRRARGVGAHSSHADTGNGGEEPPSPRASYLSA